MKLPKKFKNDFPVSSDADFENFFDILEKFVKSCDANTQLEFAAAKWNETASGLMSVLMLINMPVPEKMATVFGLAVYLEKRYPTGKVSPSIVLTDEDEFPKGIDLED